MKTTIYNFRKSGFILIFILLGLNIGFSQAIDADISLLSVSPASGPYQYGQKITYNFRVTNYSQDPYDITRVVLRDYLPEGLEYNQADNSMTWLDLGGGVLEASSNDFIPFGGGTKDYSIVLTIVGNSGGYDAWKNKIELFQFFNNNDELSLNDPDNHTNDDTDWFEYRFDIFDLALKSVTGNVYPDYGTNVTFDITVYNQGSMDATNVVVANYTLPGYTFDPANNPSWSYDAVTGNWKYTFPGPIAPGTSQTQSIVLMLNPVQTQSDWANYAEIVSAEDIANNPMTDVDGTFDEDYTNDAGGKPGSAADDAIDGDGTGAIGGTDPLTDEDNQDPGYAKIFDLALKKTTDEGTLVNFGDLFTFHFTIYNQGTVPVKDVLIKDYLPSGYQYNAADNAGLGWTLVGANLENIVPLQIAPGASTTVDLNLELVDVVSDHTEYVNFAEIAAANDQYGNAFNDFDDSDSEMNSNSVSEREVLPGSVWDDDIWRTGANGYQDDFDPGIAYFMDLAVKQTVLTPGPYHAGDDIQFSVKIYNQGGITARDIEIVDYIPSGYQFSTTSFPDWIYDATHSSAATTIPDVITTGDSIEKFVYLKIIPVDDKFGSYVNTVEIKSVKDYDFNLIADDVDSNMDEDNTNDAGGQYRSPSDDSVLGDGSGNPGDTDALTDEDDSDPALPDVYDMALKNVLLTAAPYQYGQDLTFRFTVYNQGNMAVQDPKIADYLPDGYDIVTATGWTVTGNTMTYEFAGQTMMPGDSLFVDAVLRTKMTNGGEKDWIHYAEVTNINDAFGADKSGWDLDSDLGSNNPEELAIQIGSPDDDAIWVKGPYLGEDEDDHDPAGIELFDLALRKIINSIYYPFEYGDVIPFKITVFNQGSIEAKNIKVTDNLKCGYQFILGNNPGWVEDALNNRVEYTLSQTLAPGASVDITLNLIVRQCVEAGDSWNNQAEISYAEDGQGNDMSNDDFDSTYDTDFTNDPGGTPDTPEDDMITGDGKHGPGNGYEAEEDDHDVARMHVFDLALKKTLVDQDPHYGDTLTFNITIFNQGNDDATNVDIKDYEPEGFVFDPTLNPGWSGNIFTNLNYTYSGTIAAKDSAVVELKLVMIGTNGGDDFWLNYAEIADADNATDPNFIYLDPDSTPDSNTATERSVKPGDPDDDNILAVDKGGKEDDHDPAGIWVYDLALKKEIITPGPYFDGDTVEFKVTVYNQGNKMAREIQIVDFNPAGLTYSSTNFPLWHSDNYTGNSHSSISQALNPGDSVVLPLYYIVKLVDNKCGNAYTNNAEIFEFRDENLFVVTKDFDSTPDYIENNDIGGTPDTPEDNHVDDDGHDYNKDGIKDEDDSDPAKLEIIDVALKAELMTPPPYYYGQDQQFRIRVFNQGNDTIRNTEIQGYIPDGYQIDWTANPGWNSLDTTYTIMDSIPNCDSFDVILNLKMIMTPGGEKDWINYFEVSHVLNKHLQDRTGWDMDSQLGSDTPEERSVALGDANDNNVMTRGVGFGEDQDDHDPAGLEIFDLALTKSYDDPYPHYYGDTIHFELKIYNQGSIITTNEEITDYVPPGYIFDGSLNPDWTFDANTRMAVATFADAIAPGDTLSKFLNLVLTDSYESGDDWENAAEISKFADSQGVDQTGNDFDSTNDQIRNNDPGLDETDFVEGDGKNGPNHGYPQIEDDADLAIVPVFDLAIKKTIVTGGPYHYGDNITFKIDLYNQGNQVAEQIVLNDYIALGYTFDAGLNPNWNFANGTATYNVPGQLNPDQSTSVNIILTLERTDGGYDNWINYAEVASAENPDGLHNVDADSNPGSDSDHERAVKPDSPDDDKIDGQYISENEDEDDHDPAGIEIFDLALRKTIETAGPTFDYAQQIDFKIEIFNQGNTDAKNIQIEEEAIPCGFEFDVAANTDWTYNANTRNATYTYTGLIQPGHSVVLHVFMTVWDCHNDDWQNSWKNNVEITSAEDGTGANRSNDDIDSNYDNNPLNDLAVDDAIQLPESEDDDDHDFAVAKVVDLALKIEADDRGPFAPGEIAAFTITVYNQGNDSLKSIKIFDYLSPGYSFVGGATNPGWSMFDATTAQYTYSSILAPRDSFELPIKLMVQLGTQLSDWTHYAEVAQAIDMVDLVLIDDADGIYASDTDYEREVEVGDPWDNEIFGIGYKRTPFEDMDDHDPASVDVVGKVGDFVWEDKDGDGIQDPGEPGIPGVIVELHNCDPNSGIDIQYDTTDAFGAYLFDMVIPGDYFVRFILPGDYEFTLDNVGPDDNVDSDVDGTNGFGTTECFEVEANEEQLDIDAGAYICVPVGDLVWLDNNRNNVYDSNENGVNGLKVELYRWTDGQWVMWDYEYTSIDPESVCGDGYYYFCTNPGTYYLRFVTPPTGLVPAQPHKGGDPTKDSDITRAHGLGTTNTFYLTSGTPGDLTIDAGYYEMAQIINSMAWIDANSNGLRESGEAPLANMEVELYDADGQLYNSTITGSDGHYQLDYLQAEDFYLKFIIPSNYSSVYGFTAGNQGDDTIDSDVTGDNGYGTTEMFALQPEEEKEYQDAGIAEGSLPLNYVSLGAKWMNSFARVYWSTANEQNIVKFIVQRSFNSTKFEDIGEVAAKEGTSNYYEFDDTGKFKDGVYYYRIIEVDAESLTTKSKIVPVFVSLGYDKNIVEVYPNPAVDETSVRFVNKSNTKVNISLLDIQGKMAIADIVNEEMGIGDYEVKMDISNLKPATYYLKVESGDDIVFKKVIVLRK